MRTLETFLTACGQLQPGVNLNKVIVALMNRLAAFAKHSSDAIPADMEMFPLFQKHCAAVIQAKDNLAVEAVLELQVALVNFASAVYPERKGYIDLVLGFAAEFLTSKAKLEKLGRAETATLVEPKVNALVTQLLALPLEHHALAILELANFPVVMALLNLDSRKALAVDILKAELKTRETLSSVARVDLFLGYVSPLIKDDEGVPLVLTDDNRYAFDAEQNLVARLVHLLRHADTDEQYKLYVAARKHFGQGGPHRIGYTLVPLVFGALNLARRIYDREAAGEEVAVASKKVLQFVHQIVTALNDTVSAVCLRLFLQAAAAADYCRYEAIVYEFMAQAILTYEEKMDVSTAQFSALTLIVASLQQLKTLTAESWDTLSTKCAVLAAKQLKKPDASLAVALCSHLFWTHQVAGADAAAPETVANGDQVLQCMQVRAWPAPPPFLPRLPGSLLKPH